MKIQSDLATFVVEEGLCCSVEKEKGTTKEYEHNYLSYLYKHVFEFHGLPMENLLELGIGAGASIELWRRSGVALKITGVDPNESSKEMPWRKHWRNIQIIHDDAYRRRTYKLLRSDYSLIIDDGPHSYWSQKKSLRVFPKKLEDDGFYILEDVFDLDRNLESYAFSIPNKFRHCVFCVDLRGFARNSNLSAALVIHNCKRYSSCRFEDSLPIVKRLEFENIFSRRVLFRLQLEKMQEFVVRIILEGLKYRIRLLKS